MLSNATFLVWPFLLIMTALLPVALGVLEYRRFQ